MHRESGGSAGLLYEGKKTTYEGGMRVPAIAWWPGTVPASRTCEAVATTMDLFPTILNLAKARLPQDRELDGVDIYPVLTGKADKASDVVFYYNQTDLYAIRKGPWKIHFITRSSTGKEAGVVQDPPLLYQLEVDPSERFNVSKDNPAVVEELRKLYADHTRTVKPVPLQFDRMIENHAR